MQIPPIFVYKLFPLKNVSVFPVFEREFFKRQHTQCGVFIITYEPTMEVILGELQKNNVEMNLKILSHYINDLAEQHKTL